MLFDQKLPLYQKTKIESKLILGQEDRLWFTLFLYLIGPLYLDKSMLIMIHSRVLSIFFSHKCMCNFAKIFSEKDVNIFILGPITLTYD